MTSRRSVLVLLALLAAVNVPLWAQVVSGSARAAGLADNYGALARGYTAGFWNPANLGQRGNPFVSLGLPSAQGDYGTNPISLDDIKHYEGKFIPNSVKDEWLSRIGPNGTFEANVGGDLRGLGLSVGPFAITAGSVANARANLPHDAVSAILYGNGGPGGTGDTLSFTNGRFRGYGVSQVAASVGFPLPIHLARADNERFSIGVTGKYVAGHGLIDARDGVGNLTPDSASVRFPVIMLYDEGSAIDHSGWGLDVGLAWTAGPVSAGVTVYDVVNTFKFDPTRGRVTSGFAFANADSSSSSFDDIPLSQATDSLKQAARRLSEEARFKPTTRVAFAYAVAGGITLSGDVLFASGSERSLLRTARTTAGVGIEIRSIPLLPLRAGFRQIDNGTLWTVGTGLNLGGFNVDGAYGKRSGGGTVAALGVSLGGH